jgi:hypothetical protein
VINSGQGFAAKWGPGPSPGGCDWGVTEARMAGSREVLRCAEVPPVPASHPTAAWPADPYGSCSPSRSEPPTSIGS